jgi:hypothetical protein
MHPLRGASDLKTIVHEGECLKIPEDHEIITDPCFAKAARSFFFRHPRYMSVSIRDMMCAEAAVWLAGIRDLKSMRKFLSNATTSATLDTVIAEFERVFSEYPDDIRQAANDWVGRHGPGEALSPTELDKICGL